MTTTESTNESRLSEVGATHEASDPTRHIAEPGPLGLAAFAATTFLLSLFNAGIVPDSLEKVVLPLALFYGGLAQLLAGMWEFRKNNTFGATAFVSYGAFWLAFAGFVQFTEPALQAGGASKAQVGLATGLFLLMFAIFTAYMTLASLRTTAALIAVFVLLTLTFLALAIAEIAGASGLATVGGILGLLTALAAWYASAAGVTNATWGRVVLPVGPRS
ncbi:acetate uptake transporter [Actinomycetospora endophytica]|uniref:Acetate uptake transporter n=1 Tax=Actinomycetospora endophytica TaxID=2291215 RepID=A0ABS8PHW7_9PSEU|nr:acetate uptake transporter [Actinomycetospora endophytica]MCD2197856.1 acetate uptake transporter [Actinomycetospora endophytica]